MSGDGRIFQLFPKALAAALLVYLLQPGLVRGQLFGGRRDDRKFRTVGIEPPDGGLGRAGLHRTAAVLEQAGLAACHGEIDVGQDFGVEQRAVQRAAGVVHAVAPAQRIEVVLLPRVHLARELQRVNDGAMLLDARRGAFAVHQRQLVIKEADVERRVMDDQLRVLHELEKIPGNVGELRLVRELLVGDAVNLNGAGINLASGIDVLLVTVIARPPVNQLHAADFDDAVAFGGFEASGFGIENNLSQVNVSILVDDLLNNDTKFLSLLRNIFI